LDRTAQDGAQFSSTITIVFSNLKIKQSHMKYLLLFLSFVCLSILTFAQDRVIRGKVTDDTGAPLQGVSVIPKGSKTGVQTDKDGNFTINVPGTGSTVISFSYTGHKPTSVSADGSSPISVQLERNAAQLDDVVVIGYTTSKRKDLAGSVSSVTAKQLKDVPLSSAAEAIQGRLAGVQVTVSEGAPGADIIVRVRGGGSITQDNSPLYIVDGVQVEKALDVIAPQDIATIDVLKDASTTAIYGARAANGVVIITTKSGRPGKTQVGYNGSFGFRQLPKTMGVLSPYDFVTWQYERSRANSADSASFAQTYGTTWDTLNNYKNIPFINWQDEVFGKNANFQNHNVFVSGGDSKTTFNLSVRICPLHR
jgi:TonB-linked SusC/RagA family outer membrane protein